jgi:hypothetical protein
LLDLLMSERAKEIDCFLDFMHVVYLVQCVWSKVPKIDYEPIVEVIQDCDLTYDDLDQLNFWSS